MERTNKSTWSYLKVLVSNTGQQCFPKGQINEMWLSFIDSGNREQGKANNSTWGSQVFTEKIMFRVIRALSDGEATPKGCPKGTRVHKHAHSFRSFVSNREGRYSTLACEYEPGNLAVPMAILHRPWDLLSDHEFQLLKPSHSQWEEGTSQVWTSTPWSDRREPYYLELGVPVAASTLCLETEEG